MTQCSESRTEAARLTPLLTPRTLTGLATWNIRTMYETGKTVQAAREMKRYKIRMLGLCETRWIQSGQLRLSSGEQLLYSGHIEEGAPHIEGVALMLAPEAHAALIGWEPVSSRIITAKFTTKKKDIRLNIIQCYAPTSDAEEEKKDDFYQQLQAVLDRRGTKDITILMGDFNAKIGMDNIGYEDIMGTHGLGQMNENGERFADLCALNQLVIGGSIFPHKRIHRAIYPVRFGWKMAKPWTNCFKCKLNCFGLLKGVTFTFQKFTKVGWGKHLFFYSWKWRLNWSMTQTQIYPFLHLLHKVTRIMTYSANWSFH